MASEPQPDDASDEPITRPPEDWRREVREKLLEAIHDGPSTPLTEADWDEMRRESQRRHGAAPTTPPSTPADATLDPVRREFDESGMSEEDLVRFLTEVRDEVKRGKRAPEDR